ncbi:MAG: hypothetical protein JXA42_03680 [Anaerolineales bacterium]|nr:hypothetical protein [Anaerolineales bacterium]
MDIERFIAELMFSEPTTPMAAESWVYYSDSGGAFSFSYPSTWIIVGAEAGVVVITGPYEDDPSVFVRRDALPPGPPLSEYMAVLKSQSLEPRPGYTAIADEELIINGRPALKHIFQSVECGVQASSILLLVQGNQYLCYLIASAPTTSFEDPRATLDRIVYSLVVN